MDNWDDAEGYYSKWLSHSVVIFSTQTNAQQFFFGNSFWNTAYSVLFRPCAILLDELFDMLMLNII